jgi:hypothetical protein
MAGAMAGGGAERPTMARGGGWWRLGVKNCGGTEVGERWELGFNSVGLARLLNGSQWAIVC